MGTTHICRGQEDYLTTDNSLSSGSSFDEVTHVSSNTLPYICLKESTVKLNESHCLIVSYNR